MEQNQPRSTLFKAVPWTQKDMVKAVLAAVILSAIIILLMSVAILIFGVADIERDYTPLAAAFAAELAILGTTWWFSVRKYGDGWRSLGFVPFDRTSVIPLVLLTLFLALIINIMYGLIVTLLGLRSFIPPPLPPILREPGPGFFISAVLVVLVAPPIEEVFFRGFLFAGISHRYGVAWGAVLSSLVFSLFHLQLGVIIPVFLLGLLLAWLYARTGSLWPPVIAHLVYNGLVLAAAAANIG